MRYGMTIPLDGVPLGEQREYFEELAGLGYTDLWTAETNAMDGFTPLALASTWAQKTRLGCAIFPAYTRGPGLLASSIAGLCQAAPGRFVVGIGSSSNVIVENWNGIPFEKPYQRVRDTVKFLRQALRGEKVTEEYETFSVKGFRLGAKLEQPPKILVAALRQGMLKLAGKLGDGAIINWLSAEDVKTVAPFVKQSGDDKEIVARIFVCPNPDAEKVRNFGRMAVSSYMNVPVYAAFQEWLGRGEALAGMWAAWKAGERKQALAEIPDEVVDDLVVHGTPEQCRARIQEYYDNGITTSSLAILPFDPSIDHWDAVRSLAPNAG